MVRLSISKKFLVAAALSVAGLAAGANQARAGAIVFGSFQDTAPNQWVYTNSSGSLNASGHALFIALNNTVLNPVATGIWNESLIANATGAATHVNPLDLTSNVQQPISGTLTFTDSLSNIVFQAGFSGAVLSGPVGSTGSGLGADDAVISGQITGYASSAPYQAGAFVDPLTFSISLTQVPGLNIATSGNTSNFVSFTATAQGSFSSDSGSGATPTPLPAAVWGGLSLMTGLAGFRATRRRKA